jgi:hypothetical protein
MRIFYFNFLGFTDMDLISDLAFGELSDFVIFFSGSLLNDKEDEFFDEDSIFTHIFKFQV